MNNNLINSGDQLGVLGTQAEMVGIPKGSPKFSLEHSLEFIVSWTDLHIRNTLKVSQNFREHMPRPKDIRSWRSQRPFPPLTTLETDNLQDLAGETKFMANLAKCFANFH